MNRNIMDNARKSDALAFIFDNYRPVALLDRYALVPDLVIDEVMFRSKQRGMFLRKSETVDCLEFMKEGLR